MTTSDVEVDETILATRNAAKLGLSLLFTWGIAIAMRLFLPRYLGPDRFGSLSFADALTTTFFVALGLGVNVYVRKQVAVHISHASDFIGGTFILRVGLTALIFAAIAIMMRVTGQPAWMRHLVYLFAVAQFFVHANATLSALLHAKGSVGGMSVLAVVTKVVWAVGLVAAMVTRAGLWAFAVSYLASESIETVVLYFLARRHLGLVIRVDSRATKAMMLFSLPYYLNEFATTAYGKLDVALLAIAKS
ncbi:MAG: oligosaccharide flippase family protein, partial [Polyangiaceae bacterium]